MFTSVIALFLCVMLGFTLVGLFIWGVVAAALNRKSAGSLSDEENRLLGDLHRGLRKMEGRIHNLEEILSERRT